MDQYEKIVAAFIGFIVFLSIVTTAFGGLVGSDMAIVHIWLTNSWYNGIVPFSTRIFPPSYHITVALLARISFTTPETIYMFLQCFMYGAIFYTTYLLVKSQIQGSKVAAFVVFLMASSVALWDRGLSPAIQAVDMLLVPLMIMAYLEDSKRWFVFLSVYLFYGHAIYAFAPLFGVFVYDILFNKHENLGVFLIIFLLFVPITWLMFSSGQLLGHDVPMSISASNNPQELAFLRSPASFSFKYVGFPIIMLLTAGVIYNLFDGLVEAHYELPNFRLFRISLCWLFSLSMLIFWFPDRFLEYAIQPLSILVAIWLPDTDRAYAFYPLVVYAFMLQFVLFLALLKYGGVNMSLSLLSFV